jgi:hypothetical protein
MRISENLVNKKTNKFNEWEKQDIFVVIFYAKATNQKTTIVATKQPRAGRNKKWENTWEKE